MRNSTIIFEDLVKEAKQCSLCVEHLPYGVNPIFSIGPQAKVVLIGQAPGLIAHQNTKAFSDKSGERLRQWLHIDTTTFYDENKLAIMPMGFCFPGYKNGADAPPRKECAPTWHEKMLHAIQPELVLLVGRYAQQYYLPKYRTLTDAIKNNCDEKFAVLPHPSGRNNRWLAQHPWFETEYLPHVVARLTPLLV
ncbi:uracil-DNA glycosylase family 4 [Alteromonas sp. 76-1]|jgi:uracil-DNA glycosylase family 4|uniref:uracil-DNA glycosylase family protein n=1 Tax=Alteromonas sp. 76-1 TaxID=2358187 RepID=UPI000FD185A9|nr:uracil-DNA glycosylase family protein [Alteromonas sp. 76-1]VEL98445.1 uracil-DNA glycosylase family 4 [Alteromonas sp. 76-1]